SRNSRLLVVAACPVARDYQSRGPPQVAPDSRRARRPRQAARREPSEPVADDSAGRDGAFPDLVDRQFTVLGPDRLWVADITDVAAGGGVPFLAAVRAMPGEGAGGPGGRRGDDAGS